MKRANNDSERERERERERETWFDSLEVLSKLPIPVGEYTIVKRPTCTQYIYSGPKKLHSLCTRCSKKCLW